ncbi:MAG: hypothetical protein CEN87_416 [Parcubacteria group bacterium Licking1014_1]|nr:MAG: hypothetical protein CEN87_416 [Parcubacteria group bacterium Licking1014_1]
MELSEATQKLIAKYNVGQQSLQPKQGVSTIHVDEVASKVAAFYEQIRTIVDWKEEHLMRRSAIIRKLKRRFLNLELDNFSEKENMAESLVLELVRGGHFPNDKIEESKIQEAQETIKKYILILKNSPEDKKGQTSLQFYNWLVEIAACEIEETLAPAMQEMSLIDYMFGIMKERIKISDKVYESGLLKKEDADIQIYIAVQQALFKLDKPIISYNLIKYKYPQWEKADEQLFLKISQNIYKIWKKIEKDLSNPLAAKFYAVCEKYDTPYLLLGDILSQNNAEEIKKEISEPPALEQLIKNAYSKRLAVLKQKIQRAAIYSTMSIFITKILSLLILEILLAKMLIGHLNTITLITDISVPTLLMFIIVVSIKRPSKKNLNIVVMETIKIVYQKEKQDIYEIKIRKRKGLVTRTIISLVYAASAFVSFGAIYLIFNYFGFPLFSIIINIIFIALILFAGTAISKRAQELTIEDEKEGFLSFLSDVFFLPVQGLGKWLSVKWKKYNAITAFLNALIDMPFSVFVEFLEKWRYFIKEKKEEMR